MTETEHVEKIQTAVDAVAAARRDLAFRIEAALTDGARYTAIAYAAGITSSRVVQIAREASLTRYKQPQQGRPRRRQEPT